MTEIAWSEERSERAWEDSKSVDKFMEVSLGSSSASAYTYTSMSANIIL